MGPRMHKKCLVVPMAYDMVFENGHWFNWLSLEEQEKGGGRKSRDERH